MQSDKYRKQLNDLLDGPPDQLTRIVVQDLTFQMVGSITALEQQIEALKNEMVPQELITKLVEEKNEAVLKAHRMEAEREALWEVIKLVFRNQSP